MGQKTGVDERLAAPRMTEGRHAPNRETGRLANLCRRGHPYLGSRRERRQPFQIHPPVARGKYHEWTSAGHQQERLNDLSDCTTHCLGGLFGRRRPRRQLQEPQIVLPQEGREVFVKAHPKAILNGMTVPPFARLA